MLATLFFAFVAGTLTVLSPCVLPVLPMVLGAAASKGRSGPVLLALGLTLSFVAIGMFVALFGFAIGLDEGVFRQIAAVLMIAVGLVLVLPVLQTRLATAGGLASGWINDRFASVGDTGNGGPFGLGLLMGAIWAPCVGPDIGGCFGHGCPRREPCSSDAHNDPVWHWFRLAAFVARAFVARSADALAGQNVVNG